MNVIDYAHIFKIFLISNDKSLTKQKDIQDHKTTGLIKVKGKGVDPEKVIFNFLSDVFSDNGNSLLSKGLNFSILPTMDLPFHRRLKHSVLEENLRKKELESLRNLSKHPDIII